MDDDPQAEYREAAERHRQGLPDPRTALLAYTLSSACIALLAVALLATAHGH
ncbi:hypothetical protein GCM10010430_65810 [Kitasatospora cystarginea]|uniref:Uncharacterized protein n=1 Tax=Kitasatospora cystarginea TaxID=58350 RepID=A0ABN3ETX6_9ACTN